MAVRAQIGAPQGPAGRGAARRGRPTRARPTPARAADACPRRPMPSDRPLPTITCSNRPYQPSCSGLRGVHGAPGWQANAPLSAGAANPCPAAPSHLPSGLNARLRAVPSRRSEDMASTPPSPAQALAGGSAAPGGCWGCCWTGGVGRRDASGECAASCCFFVAPLRLVVPPRVDRQLEQQRTGVVVHHPLQPSSSLAGAREGGDGG